VTVTSSPAGEHAGTNPSAPLRHTVDTLNSDALDELYDEIDRLRAKVAEFDHIINWHTTCASFARILDSSRQETMRAEKAETTIARVRGVLPFAKQVVATSGPGPASAVQAVIDRLVAALDIPADTAPDIPADKNGPAIPNVQASVGEAEDGEADTAADELTAEEARDLADDLGTQLYRAQDALAFVEECCVIAERTGRAITVADVRTWLKGAQCGRQLAADPGLVGDPAAPPVHLVTWTGAAIDAGPSVREAAADDRRWDVQKGGE
jgi:polyhydroxyalkanoate synthesis regulator phasin